MQTSILNHVKLQDEAFLGSVVAIKGMEEAITILKDFEDNNNLVYKEGLFSFQNTNRENYPLMFMAFVADVNKSVELVIKSLLLLNSHPTTCELLLENIILFDHVVAIEDDIIICQEHKEAFSFYFQKTVYPHLRTILSLFEKFKNSLGLTPYEQEKLKKYESIEFPENPLPSTIKAIYHPIFIGGFFKNVLEKIRPYHTNSIPGSSEAIMFFTQTKFDSIFNNIYYSCNLFDLKLIPQDALIYPIVNAKGSTVELVSYNSCTLKKSRNTLSQAWQIDFSIEFYLKRILIEKATKLPFFSFINALRDFFSKDMYSLQLDDTSWSEKHPLISGAVILAKFENALQKIRADYDNDVSALAKLPENEREGSLEYLETIAKKQIENLVNHHIMNQHFIQVKQEESYIKSGLLNVLDFYYNAIDETKEHIALNPKYFRERATFHTTMINSYVFDFRPNAKEIYSDATKQLLEKEPLIQNMIDILKEHKYHDFFEIDADAFGKKSSLSLSDFIDFFKAINLLKLPVPYRCSLKFRKLGNYKASGIYFSHSKTMGIDFRHKFNAYIHETAHHIDLNKTFINRKGLVKTLQRYFYNRIRERREYYFRSEELVARAAEIAMVLNASNYRLNKKLQDPLEIIAYMKEAYESDPIGQFMESWHDYNHAPEYISIEDEIKRKNFKLLDLIDYYFSSFWGWERIEGNFVIESSKAKGHGDSNSIYNKSHHSMKYYMAEIYNLSYPLVSAQEIVNDVSDFFVKEFPLIENTGESYNNENIILIKKLWNVFLKCESQNDFKHYLLFHKLKPRIDICAKFIIYRDFKAKFFTADHWEDLKEKLDEMLEILSRVE